ncbi:hypothetical protein HGG75_24030 [Ochrobactrum pseudogrignonense]|nr:hypothetical protein [Brucella pseudogrignonensis]
MRRGSDAAKLLAAGADGVFRGVGRFMDWRQVAFRVWWR